ncbi:MAG: MFS transporter [Chloroflexota bacterium]|nr:MFS transporter [Chloroflexota bacterium]
MRRWDRLYYGWVMLLALACTQVVSWGILYYGFSVFLKPIGGDLGWSRAAMTGAFSLALACSGVAGLGVGRWVDRHGPRLLMTAGSCAATLLLLALSVVRNLALFYLIWAALGVTMAAIFYEPAFAAIATWFARYRARALTIITFVGGFASVIFIPLISWLIRAQGWRMALVTLAIILAATTIPLHAFFLRRRPQDLGLLPDGEAVGSSENTQHSSCPEGARSTQHLDRSVRAHDAFRSASFRWLTTAFCLAFLANVAVTVHLIPYLTDHGFSTGFAATAAGLIGILALPGRLIFTPLGGRIPRRYVAAGIFLFQTVGLVVLVTTTTTAGVIAFVILFGIGFGAITPARAALVAEMYGPREYGTISGVLALFVTGARAAAPVSAGLLYTLFGRYEPVFWIIIVISILGMGAVLLIERDLPEVARTDGIAAPV